MSTLGESNLYKRKQELAPNKDETLQDYMERLKDLYPEDIQRAIIAILANCLEISHVAFSNIDTPNAYNLEKAFTLFTPESLTNAQEQYHPTNDPKADLNRYNNIMLQLQSDRKVFLENILTYVYEIVHRRANQLQLENRRQEEKKFLLERWLKKIHNSISNSTLPMVAGEQPIIEFEIANVLSSLVEQVKTGDIHPVAFDAAYKQLGKLLGNYNIDREVMTGLFAIIDGHYSREENQPV